MAGRDVLPPKRLELTLQRKDEAKIIVRSPKSAKHSNKIKMMSSLTTFKTILEDRELKEMLGKTKFRPVEKLVQNARHTNMVQRIAPQPFYSTTLVKGVTGANEPRLDYVRQGREIQLPVNSLRAQIESMGRSLKELQRRQQLPEDEVVGSKINAMPRALKLRELGESSARGAADSGSLEGHYPKRSELLSDKLSKNLDPLKKHERILLSDLSSANMDKPVAPAVF